jgi:hypothetical protein
MTITMLLRNTLEAARQAWESGGIASAEPAGTASN